MYFFRQLLLFSQSLIDITTNNNDFDVCIMCQTVPESAIEDDGSKNKM